MCTLNNVRTKCAVDIIRCSLDTNLKNLIYLNSGKFHQKVDKDFSHVLSLFCRQTKNVKTKTYTNKEFENKDIYKQKI